MTFCPQIDLFFHDILYLKTSRTEATEITEILCAKDEGALGTVLSDQRA